MTYICKDTDCYKRREFKVEYKGEMLYFCAYHYTQFAFALWYTSWLEAHQHTEQEEEPPT